MSEKRPASLLLFDIAESIGKIDNYTKDISFEQLMQDDRTRDAILRNIQIIGEAAKHIPASLIAEHPDVDWGGIAGMRDIITHRYFRVDWLLIWTSIHEELPVLRVQIQKLITEDIRPAD